METLQETINGVPNICGSEDAINEVMNRPGPHYLPESDIDFAGAKSAFANALHMQQPLIPAGGGDLQQAAIISNLKHMMDHQEIGDNHNAPVFQWCYKRIGEFIPELVTEGKKPRIMLDYAGCLFHGLRMMGADDVIEALQRITCDPTYRKCVEWLATPWGHAVAPSTPVQDYRKHVVAWQHHFAAIFGTEALARVRGFSPSEMALPNQPDVAYEFVKTLKDCGFLWVLVQEHTIENPENGHGIHNPHVPHRMVCTNSRGETASIMVLIKTQGSDTKLVAQMQPYYEAMGLDRQEVNGIAIPPLATQIGDGENGGVMMNEFPPKFLEVMRSCTDTDTPAMNGTEYLEYLFSLGLREEDFPVCQPLHQKKIWDRFESGSGPEKLEQVIESIRREDHQFHMEGGSWTSELSWVQGYENVTGPMEEASALFDKKLTQAGVATDNPSYRNALYHLLMSQTSCYRYWGQGEWTDYGREICRRSMEIVNSHF